MTNFKSSDAPNLAHTPLRLATATLYYCGV